MEIFAECNELVAYLVVINVENHANVLDNYPVVVVKGQLAIFLWENTAYIEA